MFVDLVGWCRVFVVVKNEDRVGCIGGSVTDFGVCWKDEVE